MTAAPAIALEIVRLLGEAGLALAPKADFNPIRPRPARFAEMTDDERAEAAACDPRWGHIVCRCESVTEGEIVEALHRSVHHHRGRREVPGPGRAMPGRRTGRVVAIISRELAPGGRGHEEGRGFQDIGWPLEAGELAVRIR